jgi:hypothetical protein
MEAIPFAIRGLVLLSWRLLVGGLKPGCQKENWLTFLTYFNSIQKKSALSSFVHLLNAAKSITTGRWQRWQCKYAGWTVFDFCQVVRQATR